MASLEVPGTVVEMSPTVELPPTALLTSQLTAVLVVPLTVAVRDCAAKVARVTELEEIVTLTCARVGQEPARSVRTVTPTNITYPGTGENLRERVMCISPPSARNRSLSI